MDADNRDLMENFIDKLKSLGEIIKEVKTQAQIMTRTMAVITQQPEDVSGALDSECYFEVKAENASAYAWQRGRENNWSILSLESARTSKLEFSITADRARYQYRCRVKGIDGAYVYSEPANMYIEEG